MRPEGWALACVSSGGRYLGQVLVYACAPPAASAPPSSVQTARPGGGTRRRQAQARRKPSPAAAGHHRTRHAEQIAYPLPGRDVSFQRFLLLFCNMGREAGLLGSDDQRGPNRSSRGDVHREQKNGKPLAGLERADISLGKE